MKVPRLTRSIFLDQFLLMQGIGVLIGLAFPKFLVLYGFEAASVLTLEFYLVCQVAGQVVGLISFLLVSTVIRPHLKLLANSMHDIAEGLEKKTFSEQTVRCDEDLCQIRVDSRDEIGVTAKAYNRMLASLLQAHEVERVFNRFTRVMSENLQLEKLADETLHLLLRSTHIEAGAVVVVRNGALEVVSSYGILEAEQLAEHDRISKVISDGQEEKVRLPSGIALDGVLTQFTPSEVFLKPIEFKGSTLGVLVAATGAELADERTEQLLEIFSRSIGLAINNAMIHSKFQKLAAVDSLTNIYNRRFGMDRLREDFARSVRDQTSLSLAMIDIDHFKPINDTYGHLIGDKAIRMIAAIIKNCLREGDIVVRYGGEEFMVLMHGASSRNALNVCERIRHQVKDAFFKEGTQQIQLTVSVGLVSYPEQPAGDEMGLIDMADQALYTAKDAGRNQVVTFAKAQQTIAED
ncbi:MAG: diguanylate cyclase [Hydrogenovibrio sp.]|uniref:diguanylate cyclase n=1 Tax=Hydrogenovibrio sp. TaxID=2065821 RepID=UPI0028709B6C|nr:diguanylate cyclase [Hydrogenovibrio sp.]MDR9498275.1 diguanylate cyclase [Hydrogenovibrio sp.]